ncbi:MAG: hypothetical protein J6P71_04545 [Oscillospiraceae bacterium]|nr:hypothetical protein [Oscillospiraceae bacterium]
MKFYAKGPGNEGYIKNMEVIAFDELDGGSIFQPQLWRTAEGKYYLYGTMGKQIGILDVTDPASPRFIKRFQTIDPEKYPFSGNPKMQVADGLLITGISSGGGPYVPGQPPVEKMPEDRCLQGVMIFSIAEDPENPRFLSYWDCGVPNSLGVHRFMYDGGPYVHLSCQQEGFEGLVYVCLDISDPTAPKEYSRWWMPHQFADGYVGREFDPSDPHIPEFMAKGWLHGPPFVRGGYAYCGWSGDGVVVLDVHNQKRPRIVGHLPLCPPFASHYGGAKTHTVLPLPGRDLIVATNEGERYMWFVPNNDPNIPGKRIGDMAQALNNLHMIDVRDPSRPTLIAEFPYPEVPEGFPYKNFQQLGLGVNATFGPHNVHEPMPGKPWLEARGDRVYCCYFHAGLRVYDVSDEFVPKEIAYFIPPDPTRPTPLPGPNIACTEDLCVDDRGNIFVVTSNDGLYVLRLTAE